MEEESKGKGKMMGWVKVRGREKRKIVRESTEKGGLQERRWKKEADLTGKRGEEERIGKNRNEMVREMRRKRSRV